MPARIPNSRRRIGGFATFFVIAAILALLLLGGFLWLQHYANVLINEEVEKTLPEIAAKTGLAIRTGPVRFRLLRGTTVTDIAVARRTPEGPIPFLRIPKLRIRHHPCLSSPAYLCLQRVELTDPWLDLRLPHDGAKAPDATADAVADDEDDEPSAASSDEEEQSAHTSDLPEELPLPSPMTVAWRGGRVEIHNGAGDAGKPFLLRLEGFDGEADIFVRERRVSAKLAVTLEPMQEEGAFFADGRIHLAGTVDAANPERITIAGEARLTDLTLDYWRVADRPIKRIALMAQGKIALERAAERIAIETLQLGFRRPLVDVSGTVALAGAKPVIDLHLAAKRLPLQKLLDGIPADFIPTLKGTRVAGTLDLGLELNLDMAKPSSLVFEPTVEINDYALLQAPPKANITKLTDAFHHEVRRKGESVKRLWLSSRSDNFISYKNLGDYIVEGVLTCEDGSFFRHNGFRVEHIRDSIVQNIQERRFARGASTITMQAAKNLFLSGRKTISRKFQEMLIAYAMEQELSKERILELYLNLAEWGPGIYGIGPAAKHYFDKHPRDLTALEAAFLGSVLPHPNRSHHMYRDGFVTDQWQTYLMLIVGKMEIPIEEYARSEPFQPEFGWVRKQREERERLESAAKKSNAERSPRN